MQARRLFGLGCQEVSTLPGFMSSKHSVFYVASLNWMCGINLFAV